jgi:hypothetical protein
MSKIICRWARDNKFLVNPDGQVWPCCYLSNPAYKQELTGMKNRKNIKERKVDDIVHPVMNDYFDNKDDLNINNKPIEVILSHEWFNKTLPDSWTSDNPHRQCRVMCEVNDDEIKIPLDNEK